MRLTISQRLIWMILIATLSLGCSGVIGFINTERLTQDLKYTHDDIIAGLEVLSKAESEYLLLRINSLYHISYDEPSKKALHEAAIEQKVQSIETLFSEYEQRTQDPKNLGLLNNDKNLFADYTRIMQQVLAKSRGNDREGANLILESDWKPAGEKLTAALIAHRKYNQNLANEIVQTAVKDGQFSSLLTAAAATIGVLLTAIIGIISRKNINNSLQHIRATMRQVANDLDFTVRAEVTCNDEIGETADAFNHLLDRVQDNVRSIATGAEQVAVSASQVAQASAQIASASLNQSESASSMSATIEQMSVSIVHVGNRAGEVHRFSSESGELAGNGEQVINETMEEINIAAESVNQAADRIRQLENQSEQISGVIAVIRDVADQTNLLALNAAIEAARAGEQGRGFAVVADEVRKLAERTSASTSEIARTIESMREGARSAVEGMYEVVKQVASSVAQVDSANQLMQKIGTGSRNGVAMVDEIVHAIREQGSASNSIAQQIEKIAQMAEEGSCAAQEGAQSARELDQLAVGMQKMISAYRV